MLDALTGKYVWVNAIEGWTVAVMRRQSLEELIQGYGRGQAEPMGELTFVDMDQHRSTNIDHVEFFVQVLVRGEHTVTLENNGFSGAFPEIARRCSTGGGSFFSVFWNIHAAGFVTQAVDGTIAARFESLFPFDPTEDVGERRPHWAIGAAVDVQLAWQVCMAQLEQQTGVTVEEGWLREPHPTYRIPMPYGLYRDVEGADRI